MIEIKEIVNADEKSKICNDILRNLPSWFGVEESIIDYTKQVRAIPLYAAFSNEDCVGFVSVKPHNQYTAEICVMGILKEYHRKGIGKMLVTYSEQYCRESNREFLTVKTLDESRASKSYEKTRLFYLSVGFKPLEVFPQIWDAANPCLFMAKYIAKPCI